MSDPVALLSEYEGLAVVRDSETVEVGRQGLEKLLAIPIVAFV